MGGSMRIHAVLSKEGHKNKSAQVKGGNAGSDPTQYPKDFSIMTGAKGFPKNIKTVRIVDIKGFDMQPDGGCHVSSLKEIGKIQISKLINKGKNNRRLYITLE